MNDLFVYGTLMNDEVLTSLMRCTFPKTKAIISGYNRFMVSGENYPAIRPDKNSSVVGEVLMNVSAEQLYILDEYEGQSYERITVSVVTDDNAQRQCETYVYKPEYYKFLSDIDWCNEVFREEHMNSFIKALFRN